MLTSIFLIICGLFVSWIYYQRSRKEMLLKVKDIPLVEKHYPIIGMCHLIIGKLSKDIYKTVLNIITSSPFGVSKAFLFTRLVIVVKDPNYIQKILSSPNYLEKGSTYEQLNNQNGLITSKPDVWKPHRKMMNSTFHKTLLAKTYMQHFNEIAQHLVTNLQCKVGMDAFDIDPIITFHTTDLQIKAMFNGDIGNEKTRIIIENTKMVLQIFGDVMIHFYTYFVLFLVRKAWKFDLLGEGIMSNSYKIIEPSIENARKQYFENLKITPHEEDIKTKREILIPKLVTLVEQGYITEDDMKDHIKTMLLAGTDTLHTTLINCILCLAMNEDAQEKCAIEIKELLGDQFQNINANNLAMLRLLDRTINECMRLLPTVPYISRKCDRDFQLDDNKIIPAGTDTIIPIAIVHRSKEYWGASPTSFNPDNFLPENIANRPLLSFMPFSYGVRNCIAMKYAQHAIKIFMAYLLVNYKFSTDLKFDELEFYFSLSSQLLNKCMIRIEKR